MTTAIRWMARLCVADVALIVAMFIGLFLAKAVGVEIQPFKWPVISLAAVLMFLLFVLSAIGVVLQIFDFMRRRSSH